jgi:hypothetical protein
MKRAFIWRLVPEATIVEAEDVEIMELTMPIPALEPWRWILGVVCALGVGIAKTGVPGLGILVVPLMVLAVGDARQSAGWLLPMLCTADVFAVVYYRRHAQARRLFSLAPWVLLGMGAGAWMLGGPEGLLRRVIGSIVLVMIAFSWLRKHAAPTASEQQPRQDHVLRAAAYGVTAGFATMVANAAGPVMSMYLLAKRLPKEEFIATGAWFFFLINLSKLPVYGARGLIGARSLVFDAILLPVVVAGSLLGRAIVARLPQKAFERAVLGLTAAAAVLLLLPR